MNLERLRQLVSLGDAGAARLLVAEARRRDALDDLILALSCVEPTEMVWEVITTFLPEPDAALVARIRDAIRGWPAEVRVAPVAWLRAGDTRQTLCGALSGLWVAREEDSRHGHLLRFDSDGVALMVNFSARNVMRFDRELPETAEWFNVEDMTYQNAYTFDPTHEPSVRITEGVDVFGSFAADGELELRMRVGSGRGGVRRAYVFRMSEAEYDGWDEEDAPVKIDLNTASVSVLECLPGVGPVRLAELLELREAGPIESFEQLAALPSWNARTISEIQAWVELD